MRAFAEAYTNFEFVQQAVAQIPWGHNVRILDHVKDDAERRWYIQQAIQHGWSREVLVLQIESDLYHCQGRAVTNITNVVKILTHHMRWRLSHCLIDRISRFMTLPPNERFRSRLGS